MFKSTVTAFIAGALLSSVAYADRMSYFSRYQQEEAAATSWSNNFKLSGKKPASNRITSAGYNPAYAPVVRRVSTSPSDFPDVSRPLRKAGTDKQCRVLSQLGSMCFQRQQKLREGISSQIRFLERYPRNKHFAQKGLNVGRQELITAAQGVLSWLDNSKNLMNHFDLIQFSDKIKFTGYYTPELVASFERTERFRYPIYKKPNAMLLSMSRQRINEGALEGSDLEIAWVDDPIALFYIHMQGSGVLNFVTGERKVMKFSAANTLSFKSIATYMQRQGYLNADLSRRAITQFLQLNPHLLEEVLAANPRYIYFSLDDKMPASASGLPLIAGHTVAVDTTFIPFGAVLLAETPEFDSRGEIAGYAWRLLLPQDRGSAIKGQARIDIYMGVGERAKRKANLVTGIHRTFLLLKKDLPLSPQWINSEAG
ncbi:MAG: MltA domain-containing protein [Thiotrichaceae bacterium]|nr:MltA domain-containing protein [Thiotrichaceae bacterium]